MYVLFLYVIVCSCVYVRCLVTVTWLIRVLNYIKVSSVTLVAESGSVHPMANVSHVSVPKVFASGDATEWFKRFDTAQPMVGMTLQKLQNCLRYWTARHWLFGWNWTKMCRKTTKEQSRKLLTF